MHSQRESFCIRLHVDCTWALTCVPRLNVYTVLESGFDLLYNPVCCCKHAGYVLPVAHESMKTAQKSSSNSRASIAEVLNSFGCYIISGNA